MTRWLMSSLFAGVILASCKSDEPGKTSIKVQVSRPAPVETQTGPAKVVFDLTATNQGKTEETIYVFVVAYNMAPRPPTRGIWPPGAAPELENSSHQLIVANHKRGFEIKLKPGALLETQGEITAPPGRSMFNSHEVQIFDAEGRRIGGD